MLSEFRQAFFFVNFLETMLIVQLSEKIICIKMNKLLKLFSLPYNSCGVVPSKITDVADNYNMSPFHILKSPVFIPPSRLFIETQRIFIHSNFNSIRTKLLHFPKRHNGSIVSTASFISGYNKYGSKNTKREKEKKGRLSRTSKFQSRNDS